MSAADDKKQENQIHIKDMDDRLRRVDRHLEAARKKADNLAPIPGLHVPPQPQADQIALD
jgi:hypothetical protein